ncbi:Hypothetical predicted protein [Lecanosticta acicola]|uniref:Uncharacterized protein n=1 Tax=Lecanosticta acicola TaxID=111012 RepID=A0AAI9ED14_9PEZI|nr:Hypothetical predicted protein [Lecanosticta acicola]
MATIIEHADVVQLVDDSDVIYPPRKSRSISHSMVRIRKTPIWLSAIDLAAGVALVYLILRTDNRDSLLAGICLPLVLTILLASLDLKVYYRANNKNVASDSKWPKNWMVIGDALLAITYVGISCFLIQVAGFAAWARVPDQEILKLCIIALARFTYSIIHVRAFWEQLKTHRHARTVQASNVALEACVHCGYWDGAPRDGGYRDGGYVDDGAPPTDARVPQ